MDEEVVEADVVDLIYDYSNDEDEGTFECPHSKNRRGVIGRAEGSDLREVSIADC